MKNFEQYSVLAQVFKYPSDELPDAVKTGEKMVAEQYPTALDNYQKFANWQSTSDRYRVEEIYAKTFHIQAICYLDLGFVLFGEDYKRGEFLVNMKQEQAAANNPCGDELPDNLVNVLTLMPKLRDAEFRNELAVRVLMPAVQKMLDEFKSARMQLKTKVLRKKHKAILLEGIENGNVYQNLLLVLQAMLEQDFEDVSYPEPKPELTPHQSFINNCGVCGTPSRPPQKTAKS